ncbi:MAG: SMP-30/gluconolactonase/LRE family protein [Pseudomonadota bacterium]
MTASNGLAPCIQTHDVLGEVPTWCGRRRLLFWSDVRQCRLLALDPETGAVKSWMMPDWIGSFALTDDDRLLLASRKSLLLFDPSNQRFETLAVFESDKPDNRANDGRADRNGRFWFGTLNNADRIPTGHLYRYADGGVAHQQSDIIVPNALSWSPDGRTMYFADSWVGDIWAYDYDPDTGDTGNRRVLLAKDALPGIPDGATVDAEGCLWNARYGAGLVARITPDGRVDTTFEIATKNLTACTLGGSDLRDLYVTSARQRMSAEELKADPNAGAVFHARVATPGLPEPLAQLPPDYRGVPSAV